MNDSRSHLRLVTNEEPPPSESLHSVEPPTTEGHLVGLPSAEVDTITLPPVKTRRTLGQRIVRLIEMGARYKQTWPGETDVPPPVAKIKKPRL